jgi:hypothetical protein
MELTQNFFYSAMYTAWCGGLILGTLVAFLVTKHDYRLAEQRYANNIKSSKSFLLNQNNNMAGAMKRARLAGLRDARAILKQSLNLNDADRRIVEVERRASTG